MGEGDSSLSMGTVISLILIVLTLVVAVFMLSTYFPQVGELFNDFKKPEATVDWNREYFISDPSILSFEIRGDEANIFFKYNTEPILQGEQKGEAIGWQWSKDNQQWFSVENVERPYDTIWVRDWNSDKKYIMRFFTKKEKNLYLDEKNKLFATSLVGKSPEEGLVAIVNRVLANSEGNWVSPVGFFVYYRGVAIPASGYTSDSPELRNLDTFIDKINQISYGVRERE